jgi:hypothetical protein
VTQELGQTEVRPQVRSGTMSRAMALVLVSSGLAWCFHRFDVSALAKIDSTPAAEFIQKQRELHMHSPVFWFVCTVIMGALYLGAMDLVTQLVRSLVPKR